MTNAILLIILGAIIVNASIFLGLTSKNKQAHHLTQGQYFKELLKVVGIAFLMGIFINLPTRYLLNFLNISGDKNTVIFSCVMGTAGIFLIWKYLYPLYEKRNMKFFGIIGPRTAAWAHTGLALLSFFLLYINFLPVEVSDNTSAALSMLNGQGYMTGALDDLNSADIGRARTVDSLRNLIGILHFAPVLVFGLFGSKDSANMGASNKVA